MLSFTCYYCARYSYLLPLLLFEVIFWYCPRRRMHACSILLHMHRQLSTPSFLKNHAVRPYDPAHWQYRLQFLFCAKRRYIAELWYDPAKIR